MFLSVLMAAVMASQPATTVKHTPSFDHLWRMVAQSDDYIFYLDERSKQRTGDNLKFWTLLTYKKAEFSNNDALTKYDLSVWTVDCRQKKLSVSNVSSHVGRSVTSNIPNAPTFQLVAPESMGEVVLNAGCFNRLKYPNAAPQPSISSAITYSRSLGVKDAEAKVIQSGDFLTDADVNEIAATYRKTQTDSGSTGVIAQIKDCYATTTSNATLANLKAIERCIVFDIMGERIDAAFNADMGKQIGKPLPPAPFWEEKVWMDRVNEALRRLHNASPAVTVDIVMARVNATMKRMNESVSAN
jgi:hypothetical protein